MFHRAVFAAATLLSISGIAVRGHNLMRHNNKLLREDRVIVQEDTKISALSVQEGEKDTEPPPPPVVQCGESLALTPASGVKWICDVIDRGGGTVQGWLHYKEGAASAAPATPPANSGKHTYVACTVSNAAIESGEVGASNTACITALSGADGCPDASSTTLATADCSPNP
ncbi:unnamed protein product [Amoebophrya sp. A120]|nr:unnamed protein product [Amoebophrya sp. A120]|eukprot:GSA120T00019920001.1